MDREEEEAAHNEDGGSPAQGATIDILNKVVVSTGEENTDPTLDRESEPSIYDEDGYHSGDTRKPGKLQKQCKIHSEDHGTLNGKPMVPPIRGTKMKRSPSPSITAPYPENSPTWRRWLDRLRDWACSFEGVCCCFKGVGCCYSTGFCPCTIDGATITEGCINVISSIC